MAPDTHNCADLIAEIDELHRQQLDSNVRATYVGWTQEDVAAHEKRADRMSLLKGQLAALDGIMR
jgi:hypothetical protein